MTEKLKELDLEALRKMVCSKCGDRVGSGFGSLQGKIVNGKLVHIECPLKRVVT